MKLSPRHRECLRLVAQLRTTKEIAAELGISPGTVDGYITDAMAILGFRNRRKAAEYLVVNGPPDQFEGQSPGVVPTVDPVVSVPTSSPALPGGPFNFQNRDTDNDYGIFARLGWIIAAATALAFGFGAFAGGVESLNRLIRDFTGG